MKHKYLTIIALLFSIIYCQAQPISRIGNIIHDSGKKYFMDNDRKFQIDENVVTVKLKSSLAQSAIKTEPLRSNSLGYMDIPVPKGVDVEDFVKEMSKSSEYESVEFNNIGEYTIIPNDTYYLSQWYLTRINANNAWNYTMGNSAVIVAVLDSGTDCYHPDLGYGNDSYSNVDITNAWDFINDVNYVTPTNPHGTMVAGIIGAKTNNGIGVSGIVGGNAASGVRIFPYCVGTTNPNSSVIDDAIIFAVDHGAKIIQFSLSVSQTSAIQSAIAYAKQHGVTIVCAAGNNGSSTISYPASNVDVIAVGATDNSNYREYFSNYGTGLDIVAPGVDIYSTSLNSSYAYNDGTSFSAPQVSGVIALMMSVNPTLTTSNIKYILTHTTTKPSNYTYNTNGWNNEIGYGIVNANSAVEQAYIAGLSISGPSIVCDSAVYSIDGLIDGTEVEWSVPYDNAIPYPIMTPNAPSNTTCTIRNTIRYPYVGTLNASIKRNGDVLTVLEKKFYSEGSSLALRYSQAGCTYLGVTHPAIPSTILSPSTANFVHQGCTVTVECNYLKYFNSVGYDPNCAIPSFWNYYPSSGTIQFALSNQTGGVPFYIEVDGDGSCYKHRYLIFSIGGNGNITSSGKMEIKSHGSSCDFNIVDNKDDVSNVPEEYREAYLEQKAKLTRERKEDGAIEVYSAADGRKLLNDVFVNRSYTLDTTGWTHGTYVVRMVCGEEVFAEKFVVQ